ncbi:MAG: hypothetical protein ACE5J7_03245, partial [Candidatus Aenigmatarchaeota archaeon]
SDEYEQLLKGIKEHAETGRKYHEGLNIYLMHEVKEVYNEFRLFLKEDGEGNELCSTMFRSINYGIKNADKIASAVSKACGTDYKETRRGIRGYLKFVRGCLTPLRIFS